ncbi:MAG: hypothetical protein U9R66_05005 [Thermodesulfobacteriota bacterium]|nr:hypothetical protein [Thermodesulfobacteriota bacterium]
MLDTCVDGARVAVENIKRAAASPLGIFVSAALSGMIGIVILVAFFSMIFSGSTLLVILPVIISFNAAASGYGIVDKGGEDFPRLKVSLIVISGLLAATGCFAIIVFFPWEATTIGLHFCIGSLAALSFSFFGAWLATKSKNMKSTS